MPSNADFVRDALFFFLRGSSSLEDLYLHLLTQKSDVGRGTLLFFPEALNLLRSSICLLTLTLVDMNFFFFSEAPNLLRGALFFICAL